MKRKSNKHIKNKNPEAYENREAYEVPVNFENTEKNTEKKPVKTRWYKKPVIVKLGYMLVALIVAMTLWGYVLMSENPPRTKRLDNIQLSFESGSESDLAAKNLIILGDMHEILKDVSVDIKTTLNDLPRFAETAAEDIVQASVSVRNVYEAGEYNLTVTAVSTIGEVIAITPSTIKITVDDLISRPVPIICNLTGELPKSYWHDEPQLAAASTTVKGAKSIVDKVVRAECEIDLNGRTAPINDSFRLTMYDKKRNPVESVNAGTVFPSVIVRMDIRPTLEIPVEPTILGEEDMKDIYEIASINVFPEKLTVAAYSGTLAALSELITFDPPINIANAAEEGLLEYEVSIAGLPNNVLIIGENKFSVRIMIRERTEEKTFEEVPVRFIQEDLGKYSYNYTNTVCNVTFTGKASLIRQLQSYDFTLTLNLDGKAEGVYTLIPEIEFNDPELFGQLTYLISEINFEIVPL